jgi:[ribosomal protein S18]-alanine N-acetyltransferase
MTGIRPVRIRPIMEEDLPLVRAWMREACEAPRWSDADLAAVIRGPAVDQRRLRRGWVAEQDDSGAVGFLIAAALAIPGEPAECELEFVLVAPQARGRGIGRTLVHAVQEWARSLRAEEIWLEVRESNTRARRLYEHCGFAVVGRRQGYYADPPEDALRMLLWVEGVSLPSPV